MGFPGNYFFNVFFSFVSLFFIPKIVTMVQILKIYIEHVLRPAISSESISGFSELEMELFSTMNLIILLCTKAHVTYIFVIHTWLFLLPSI